MVERKKTDGERRGNAINSFIPRNGRAYLYLTSVKRTCVKYAPNQFPSTRLSASLFSLICRQEPVVTFGSGLFFISTADSSLSFSLTFDLFSPHRFIHPRISRLRLSACPFSFPSLFPFALFPSLPRKSLPPRGNDPLCTRGPRIRDRINRGKEEPVNAVPSLMLFFILTLRQTLISGSGFFGRKNRAVFIDVLGERNAFPSNAPSFLELARGGTRVTFFVFSFFFFSSSFFREINPLSQLIR